MTCIIYALSHVKYYLFPPLDQDDLLNRPEGLANYWVIVNSNALLNLNYCISKGKTRYMTYSHFPSFSIYNGLFDLQFNSIVQIHTKHICTYNVTVRLFIWLILQKFTNSDNHWKRIDWKWSISRKVGKEEEPWPPRTF